MNFFNNGEVIFAGISALIAIFSAYYSNKYSKKSEESNIKAQKSSDNSNLIELKMLDYTLRENQKYTNSSISMLLMVQTEVICDLNLLTKDLEAINDDSINCFNEDNKNNRYISNLNLRKKSITDLMLQFDNINLINFSDIADNRVNNCKQSVITSLKLRTKINEALVNWIDSILANGTLDLNTGKFNLNDDDVLIRIIRRINFCIEELEQKNSFIIKKTGVTNEIKDDN